MDMFVLIPGFSHYRINRETKEVQSNRQGGKWKTIKIHSCGCYRLISDKKTHTTPRPTDCCMLRSEGLTLQR